jgi:hypothetical protein
MDESGSDRALVKRTDVWLLEQECNGERSASRASSGLEHLFHNRTEKIGDGGE